MVKILVSSCEYGDFHFKGHHDKTEKLDGYEIRSIVHTDKESLVARKSMHPRMYGKINRMMNWKIYPGYDFYVWRDCRISFLSNNHVIDFVRSMKSDIGLFRHRFCKNINEEKNTIIRKIDSPYMKSRYEKSLIEAQVKNYNNLHLNQTNHFETGLFCYRKELVEDPHNLMSSWFQETMMWSANDQISLPFCLSQHGVSPHIYSGNVLNNKWTESDYKNYK